MSGVSKIRFAAMWASQEKLGLYPSLKQVKDQICSEEGNILGAILTPIAVGVAALIVVAGAFWFYKKKSASPPKNNLGGVFPERTEQHVEAEHHVVFAENPFTHTPVEAAVASAPPLPPPIAPSAYTQNETYAYKVSF